MTLLYGDDSVQGRLMRGNHPSSGNRMGYPTNTNHSSAQPSRDSHARGDSVGRGEELAHFTPGEMRRFQGIVKDKTRQFPGLARRGEEYDTRIGEVSPVHERFLDKKLHGGHKQVNPRTGLREYAPCQSCGQEIGAAMECPHCNYVQQVQQQFVPQQQQQMHLHNQPQQRQQERKAALKRFGANQEEQIGGTCALQNATLLEKFIHNLKDSEGNLIKNTIRTHQDELPNYKTMIEANPQEPKNSKAVRDRLDLLNFDQDEEGTKTPIIPHPHVKDFVERANQNPAYYANIFENHATGTAPLLSDAYIRTEGPGKDATLQQKKDFITQHTTQRFMPVTFGGIVDYDGDDEAWKEDQQENKPEGHNMVITKGRPYEKKDIMKKLEKYGTEIGKLKPIQKTQVEINRLNKIENKYKTFDLMLKHEMDYRSKIYDPNSNYKNTEDPMHTEIIIDKDGNAYNHQALEDWEKQIRDTPFFNIMHKNSSIQTPTDYLPKQQGPYKKITE